MHQIYTGKQFASEEFLSNRCTMLDREHVLRRNWTKFMLDWRHLQGTHWTHLHSKECDCIIITNKIKLMYVHPYKTTVVHKLWRLSAGLNFVNWYLQRVHAGEVNLMLLLFSDEAWFHHSWYVWPLKITLTVMLIHGVPLREVKVWRAMCYKCNYYYWGHSLFSDHKFTPKTNIFWHHLIHLSDYTRLYVFVQQENATAHNIKHFQHDQSGTQFHSDHVSS